MIIDLATPNEANVLVKAGDKVDLETKILTIAKKALIRINVAKKLNIAPEKIFQSLKKFVDDEIKKGDKLAYKKTLFSNKYVFSDYDGILKEINHQTGEVIIEVDDPKTQIKKDFFSPLKGIVVAVEKNFVKIKIKNGEFIELKQKASEIFGAKIFILENTEQLTADSIEKKIIITEEISNLSQAKCEALGAFGFLTIKKLPNPTDLVNFQFKNLDDWNKIKKTNFAYCFIEKNSSKMIFYD
jgi:hypothetical protein